MIILGINAYHADSSACLLIDGEIKVAIEEERINRKKHWAGFPILAIRKCLENQNISLEDIDQVSVNQNFFSNFLYKAKFLVMNKPNLNFYINKFRSKVKKKNILSILREQIGPLKKNCKLIEVEHHKSHVASAYFESPFDKCVNLSIDGFGDFSSVSWGHSEKNKIKIDSRILFPHSLGIFYEAFTQMLGFINYGDEYKIMGLSSYGNPSETVKVEKIIQLKKNGKFNLNLEYFNHHKKNMTYGWNNCSPKTETLFNKKIYELFEKVDINEKLTDYHKNIAASVQKVYEKVFFHILNHIYDKYKIHNLTISGGCAQNSLANGKVTSNTKFKHLFIPPNPGDAGGAVGSTYVAWENVNKTKPKRKMNAYLGLEYSDKEINKLLIKKKENILSQNCSFYLEQNEDSLFTHVAEQISSGKIIGWFQGKMEWGPRSLGNRSILADPRNPKIRDIINKKIKRRESFRPFAPSILLEHADEWFENFVDEEHFMSRVLKFKKEKINFVPSVVHLDGTGRLQTVKQEHNPRYYKLIKKFSEITNVPLVLNTSFNENEPIVCEPENALDCFLRTKMDLLVMGNYLIYRNDLNVDSKI